MSEEQDNKMSEIDNNQEINKKVYKKKENSVVEKYQFNNDDKLQLIVDKPSKPLIIEDDSKKNMIKNVDNNNKLLDVKFEKNTIIKTNKELYESYIKDLKYFSLSLNGDVIYDSSIDKSKILPVKFDNDYFILYGKKYSYNGLKIQKINLR